MLVKPAKPQLRERFGVARLRRRPRRQVSPEDAERSLALLRGLLVGPEQERIERLEIRPNVAADNVGDLLPEAVVHSTETRQHELAIALEPAVTQTITSVARAHPELYGEILAPTIGAAVKKAVADAMAAILERFNVALERSLSLRGVKWRIEAVRTGQPFAEVALTHTLLYRVEQVFLIHTESSLVLQHLVDPGRLALAPDQVAAMLSAIDSFGREAFGQLPPEEHLRKFELGELVVLVTRQSLLTLAVVVRGLPRSDLSQLMTDALERVTILCYRELDTFSGNTDAFATATPALEPLLRTERLPPPRRAHIVIAVVVALLVALAVALGVRAHAQTAAIGRLERSYVATLEREPGVVVTQARWRGGQEELAGFRDPSARSPEDVVASAGLPPARYAFAPFMSLDDRVVERRARHSLSPPPSVELTLLDHTLRLAGVAPRAWIERAIAVGGALAGIDRVDADALRTLESVEALRAIADEFAHVSVDFTSDSAQVRAAQSALLTRLGERARTASQEAVLAREGVCLEVMGHADSVGTDEKNRVLGAERAHAVRDRLVELGVDARAVRVVEDDLAVRARTVTFRLDIDERGASTCGAVP